MPLAASPLRRGAANRNPSAPRPRASRPCLQKNKMLKEKSYKEVAEFYDIVELGGDDQTRLTNELVLRLLAQTGAHRVHDMACGTGAQAIALHHAGYALTASDLSEAMLRVARRKAEGLGIAFHKADMVDVALGAFDAIIAINNGAGHLVPNELARALGNASNKLHPGGVLLFDVFDAQMMRHLPKGPVIDAALSHGDTRYVRYSSFKFDEISKVLTVSQSTHIQRGFDPLDTFEESYQLQTYSGQDLRDMALENGFSRVSISDEGMPDLFGEAGLAHFVTCFA